MHPPPPPLNGPLLVCVYTCRRVITGGECEGKRIGAASSLKPLIQQNRIARSPRWPFVSKSSRFKLLLLSNAGVYLLDEGRRNDKPNDYLSEESAPDWKVASVFPVP